MPTFLGAGRRVLPVRGAMDGFVATFVNRLDQKGRVSVPAPFRSVLAREGQDGLYSYPALDRPAIDGGGARLRQAIAERLNIFATFSEDYESLSTAFYGESRILKIDPDGRVVLPEEFRAMPASPTRRSSSARASSSRSGSRSASPSAASASARASSLGHRGLGAIQSDVEMRVRARGNRHDGGPHLFG